MIRHHVFATPARAGGAVAASSAPECSLLVVVVVAFFTFSTFTTSATEQSTDSTVKLFVLMHSRPKLYSAPAVVVICGGRT